MGVIIVDTSVVVKWFIREKYSDNAIKLLKDFKTGNIDLHAPISLLLEFANTIRKYYVKKMISLNLMNEIIETMEEIPIYYHNLTWDLTEKALQHAIKFSITVYDAVYLILSEANNGIVVTADERFYNATKEKCNIVFVANY